jgi:monoamine oxidase
VPSAAFSHFAGIAQARFQRTNHPCTLPLLPNEGEKLEHDTRGNRGGGCAGLGAAATLLSKGVDVVLVEASAILGGRAWTSSDPADLLVDMGPQFLQDPDSNPWREIMKSLGIKGIDPAIETKFRIFKDEGWVTQSEVEEVESVSHVIDVGYAKATEKLNVPPVATPMEPSPQYQALALGSNGYGSIAESAEPWQYVARIQAVRTLPTEKAISMSKAASETL